MPDKAKAGAHSRRKTSKAPRPGLLAVLITMFCLAAVFAVIVLFILPQTVPVSEPVETAEPEEPVFFTVKCTGADGNVVLLEGQAGEIVNLPEGPAVSGKTFIGWADADGQILLRNRIPLTEDLSFTAIYAAAFADESEHLVHEPYLPLDESDRFHPLSALTRREAVEIVFSLLAADTGGSGRFNDVEETDSCFTAASVLKDMGVLEGDELRPDAAITCREFYSLIAHFFPPCGEAFAFQTLSIDDPDYASFALAFKRGWLDDLAIDPDRDLTREEAAHVFNLLRGRTVREQKDLSMIGTILDVSRHDPYYWDIVEACIPHECAPAEDSVVWTSSEPVTLREEGLYRIGTELHCADELGGAVVNDSYGNFSFGSDGVYTTGMPELDVLVQAKLKELLNPEKMTPDQMLRNVYDYVTYHNSYLSVNYYEIGETGWENDEAYRMLTTGKGNCYSYAAEFGILARALGYDAQIFSGTVDPRKHPHGWVEIVFDGVPYVFDAEMEYKDHIIAHKTTCYYRLPPDRVKGWYYYKGEDLTDNVS